MATRTSSKTTTTTTTRSSKFNAILNILSFVAVCLGGIALLLGGLITSISAPMQTIANVIGWFTLCLLSFKYIRNKRALWLWVVWVIAVVMIVVGIIL